jgi:hypothetical protein
MDDLPDFLERAGRTPFAWGAHDCLLFPAAWCRAGVDPVADFRGRYRTARGALRILKREGGLLDLASRQMAAAGLQPVPPAEVAAGDVGVIRAPTPERTIAHVGAVFTGRLWVCLGAAGLVAGPFVADAAWRPHCPR